MNSSIKFIKHKEQDSTSWWDNDYVMYTISGPKESELIFKDSDRDFEFKYNGGDIEIYAEVDPFANSNDESQFCVDIYFEEDLFMSACDSISFAYYYVDQFMSKNAKNFNISIEKLDEDQE